MRVERLAVAGSVVGGLLASACCIGPLVLTLLGISGAALARRFEPFRPYLLVATYALLGSAFYFTYRRPPDCGSGSACETGSGRFGKALLWLATLIVILATTFPSYAQYLPL